MASGLGAAIEKAWYKGHPLVWLLWPLSVLFWLISAIRRQLYRAGFTKACRPGAKIIVVGNISVGGNGKTPLVIALAEYFSGKGYQVGVISRGYGAQCEHFPHRVVDTDAPAYCGDEPLLIARRTGLPVVIDPDRCRGVACLERAGCNLIISDDGLQHYRLARDVEIVVMDNRQCGNRRLLPMGPLREGVWRLNTVDMIVHNVSRGSPGDLPDLTTPQFDMTLTASHLVNVNQPDKVSNTENRQNYRITAIAGIGNPDRFFRQLSDDGFDVAETQAFADHHRYTVDDIPQGTVVMTEKDAVKMKGIAHDDCWYQPVAATLSEHFYKQVEARLRSAAKGK